MIKFLWFTYWQNFKWQKLNSNQFLSGIQRIYKILKMSKLHWYTTTAYFFKFIQLALVRPNDLTVQCSPAYCISKAYVCKHCVNCHSYNNSWQQCQGSTLTFLPTCPFVQVIKTFTCPNFNFTFPKFLQGSKIVNVKNVLLRIINCSPFSCCMSFN
jgi:hypothetical protein